MKTKKYSDEDNSRTDVNGAWKPLSPLSKDFDFFSGDEDSFENFQGRRKEIRQEKQDLRQSGLSRKDARKQANINIPNPFKNKLTEAQTKVGRAILKTNPALVASRGAYLALVRLNYRGFAYKLNAVLKDPNLKSQLEKKWYKLGGDLDNLVEAIGVGYKKDPFVCGKKCQAKELMDKKSFDGDFSNFVILGVTLTAAGVVTLASACISALAVIINAVVVSITEKKKIKSAEKIAEMEDARLTKQEKDRLALEEKKIQGQNDPRKEIINDPNISQEDKRSALKLLDEAEGSKLNKDVIKYVVIGGIALVAIFLISNKFKK
jgi:hypothetical protein